MLFVLLSLLYMEIVPCARCADEDSLGLFHDQTEQIKMNWAISGHPTYPRESLQYKQGKGRMRKEGWCLFLRCRHLEEHFGGLFVVRYPPAATLHNFNRRSPLPRMNPHCRNTNVEVTNQPARSALRQHRGTMHDGTTLQSLLYRVSFTHRLWSRGRHLCRSLTLCEGVDKAQRNSHPAQRLLSPPATKRDRKKKCSLEAVSQHCSLCNCSSFHRSISAGTGR